LQRDGAVAGFAREFKARVIRDDRRNPLRNSGWSSTIKTVVRVGMERKF